MKPTRNKDRALSWSQLSTWEWNKEDWYKKYVLNQAQHESVEMKFGKLFADSCEKGKPLAPVTLYSKVEYPLKVVFNGHPFVGFIDTYEPHSKLGEFKTGKKPWTQKRADEHGQIDAYLLMLYITHKIKPEAIECSIQWIPTKETGDFGIEFVQPVKVHTFKTKRTMQDILRFGVRLNNAIIEMDQYVEGHS